MAKSALKTVPQGKLLSISEIAKRCGINRATCAARLEDLGYEPDPTSQAKLQLYFFDDEMQFAIKSARDSLAAAKIRGLRAKTQLDELKLAEARRELVPFHEAVELAQQVVSSMYQELTVRQPKRVAGKLAQAKNAMAVKKILKTDNSRIFKGLRESIERFIER